MTTRSTLLIMHIKKGVKDGVTGVAIGAGIGLVSFAVIEINKDRINRKVRDIKTKIKMKL